MADHREAPLVNFAGSLPEAREAFDAARAADLLKDDVIDTIVTLLDGLDGLVDMGRLDPATLEVDVADISNNPGHTTRTYLYLGPGRDPAEFPDLPDVPDLTVTEHPLDFSQTVRSGVLIRGETRLLAHIAFADIEVAARYFAESELLELGIGPADIFETLQAFGADGPVTAFFVRDRDGTPPGGFVFAVEAMEDNAEAFQPTQASLPGEPGLLVSETLPDSLAMALLEGSGGAPDTLFFTNGDVFPPGFAALLERDAFLARLFPAEGAASQTFSGSRDAFEAAADQLDFAEAPQPSLSQVEAETVALLYTAAFDRDAGLPGLNFWIEQRAQGLSEEALSELFFASPEFSATYGDPAGLDNRALVQILYGNVLDRGAEPEGEDFWTEALDAGVPRARVLLAFAKSAENVAGSPEVATLGQALPGSWAFIGDSAEGHDWFRDPDQLAFDDDIFQ